MPYIIFENFIGCVRPSDWCNHSGSTFLKIDCDSDGILDPVCQDDSGKFGSRLSASDCKDTWPSGSCMTRE